MNGFRKNKGIVLELTSLLDVIMIMLFWVMTDVSASADSQKEDAKAQVQAVTQQLEEQKQKSADELEKLREDMQKQIDEAYKKAESINSNAAKNQQALDGYTQGMLISLDMRNENGSDKLYISRNDEDIMTVTPDEDISGRLISLFEGLGAADGEVMLAAVVYDGDAVLYRNMRIVENAVQAVSDKYENVYVNCCDLVHQRTTVHKEKLRPHILVELRNSRKVFERTCRKSCLLQKTRAFYI